MKNVLIVLLLIAAFILPEKALAQTDSTVTLKILSWNIYMLPRHIKHTGKLARAKEIGKLLKNADYDIIVFQEAFHGGARRIIRKALRENFSYAVGPANRKPYWFTTSSGVWILSKTPIKKLGTINFKECEGPDCWAHKGALLIEGEKNGKKFQILGTHLEAGGPQSIRDGQYKEIGEMAAKYYQAGIPQFICGDFNTRNIDTTNYRLMLTSIQATDSMPQMGEPGEDLVNHFRNKDKSGYVIDYVLCRNNLCKIVSVARKVKIFRTPWSKTNSDLSDHFAVEAVIKF